MMNGMSDLVCEQLRTRSALLEAATSIASRKYLTLFGDCKFRLFNDLPDATSSTNLSDAILDCKGPLASHKNAGGLPYAFWR
jgi:hypothetical protein